MVRLWFHLKVNLKSRSCSDEALVQMGSHCVWSLIGITQSLCKLECRRISLPWIKREFWVGWMECSLLKGRIRELLKVPLYKNTKQWFLPANWTQIASYLITLERSLFLMLLYVLTGNSMFDQTVLTFDHNPLNMEKVDINFINRKYFASD